MDGSLCFYLRPTLILSTGSTHSCFIKDLTPVIIPLSLLCNQISPLYWIVPNGIQCAQTFLSSNQRSLRHTLPPASVWSLCPPPQRLSCADTGVCDSSPPVSHGGFHSATPPTQLSSAAAPRCRIQPAVCSPQFT